MPYATVQDVRTRYADSVSGVLDAQLSALLNDANSILTIKVPDLESRISDSSNDALSDVAKALVCRAVMRCVTNPLDVSQQQMGGMGVTYRSSGVYFTDKELETLAPSASNASDYARSVRVTSPFMR